MNPGKLNKRVTFCGMDMTHKNAAGEVDPKYNDLFSLWAKIETLASETVIIEGKEYVKISLEVTIRFTPKVTDDLKVKVNGKDLEIKAIENIDEANKWLKIRCSVVD